MANIASGLNANTLKAMMAMAMSASQIPNATISSITSDMKGDADTREAEAVLTSKLMGLNVTSRRIAPRVTSPLWGSRAVVAMEARIAAVTKVDDSDQTLR